jgi:thiamine kinase-like enzyme
MPADTELQRIARLGCWRGDPEITPLAGGMTNRNFKVRDRAGTHVVRLGEDLPHHGVLRWHELAVSRAAHAAGLSPAIRFSEPGVLVMDFIDGQPLSPERIRDPQLQPRFAKLLHRCHREIPRHLHGPVLTFWPFQIVRSYLQHLKSHGSRWSGRLDAFHGLNERLESRFTGTGLVLGHNDLLAGNVLDDGSRLWLIDWDYAGFSTPLFDLANLATNNDLPLAAEAELLGEYLGITPQDRGAQADYRRMRVISLLREALWGMVSETHPSVEFDYGTYTETALARLDAELEAQGLRH